VEVAWSLRPITAIALLAAIALPWYVAVALKTDGAWLVGFLGKHNLGRFTTAMEGHSGNVLYYVVAVLAGFFPWSCFLPLAVYRLGRRLTSPAALETRAADTFVACWTGAYLVFFSLASTKLPSYVLPCYPALALATAVLIDEWIRSPALVPSRWFRAGLTTPAFVGLAVCIAVPIAARFMIPGDEWLGVLGLSLIGGGIASVWAARSRPDLAPKLFATMAVVFVVSLAAIGAGRVSRHAVSPAIAAAARARLGDEARLVAFRHFEPTMAFYAGSEVPVVHGAADLNAVLARIPAACIVTRDDYLPELVKALGSPPEIIARRRRFLRTQGEIVVTLPPPTATTAGREALSTR
jgi:4-amino-4-deoxy-L-arabinose transferase-like glycosyltransferase